MVHGLINQQNITGRTEYGQGPTSVHGWPSGWSKPQVRYSEGVVVGAGGEILGKKDMNHMSSVIYY